MTASLPDRAAALALMQEFTASDSLRKHMLAVEAAMRAYAVKFGEDADRWALAGLMHDFDYERWPNAAHAADAEHPAEGVRLLRAQGYPEDVLQAILGHADVHRRRARDAHGEDALRGGRADGTHHRDRAREADAQRARRRDRRRCGRR